MKPSEIVNLEEDWRQKVAGNAVGNWLARKGAFGTKTAVTAQGVNMAKGQAELSKASETVLKAKLLQQLEAGLRNSFSAGIVAEMSFSKKNLNRLIENTIINEAMSVDQYAKQFVKNLLVKYQITPDQETTLNDLTLKLKAKYTGPDQPFPKDEASKLIDFVFAVKSAQASGDTEGSSIKAGYGNPKGPVTIDVRGQEFKYTGAEWQDSSGATISDERSIQTLNKAYYDQSKNMFPSPTSKTSVQTKNGKYTFDTDPADGKMKWFQTHAKVAGKWQASSPPVKREAPRDVNDLNKLASSV